MAEKKRRMGSTDVLTQATPLAMLQQGMVMPSYFSMFLGFPGGALGETSAVAILLGGAYLLYKKHISWRIPTAILGTVLVLSVATGGHPVYHMLSGGLMLGAFFMATDWVTSPITARGKTVFGILIGILVVVFRIVMAPTEGVAFSILFMNAFVPLIERFTRRPFFGEQKLASPSWYTRLPWRKSNFDVRKNG